MVASVYESLLTQTWIKDASSNAYRDLVCLAQTEAEASRSLNVSHRGSIPEEKVAYVLIVNTINRIVSVSRVIIKNVRTNSRCYK